VHHKLNRSQCDVVATAADPFGKHSTVSPLRQKMQLLHFTWH